MKFEEFIRDFPMRRAAPTGDKPGKSTCLNPFMRVHADGYGFLMPQSSGFQPYPIRDEERAVEVFRELWRRAQQEAPRE